MYNNNSVAVCQVNSSNPSESFGQSSVVELSANERHKLGGGASPPPSSLSPVPFEAEKGLSGASAPVLSAPCADGMDRIGAIANWLMQTKWTWFTTFTFLQDINEQAGRRLFFIWLHRLKQSILVTNGHKTSAVKKLKAFVAVEYTTSNRVHLHALIWAPKLEQLPRYRWEARWERILWKPSRGRAYKRCGMARILPVNSSSVAYVTKDIVKQGRPFFIVGRLAMTESIKRSDGRLSLIRDTTTSKACPVSPSAISNQGGAG